MATALRARSTWLAVAAFAVTRVLLFFFAPQQNDLGPYPFWVNEYHQTSRHGTDLYAYHEARAEERAEKVRQAGRTPRPESGSLEYPPLALAVIIAPSWLVGAAEGASWSAAELSRYITAFRLEMLFWDAVTFNCLIFLVRWIYATEPERTKAERLFFYVLATAALGHLLYTRLDIVLAALLLFSLILLLGRVHYAWSFAVLAVGIHFKLVPLVLLPIFVLGSLPSDWPRREDSWLRSFWQLAVRSLVACGLVATLAIPWLALFGRRPFAFLAYHQQRGLEAESVWSSVLLALEPLDSGLEVEVGFGSYNFVSRLSPAILAVAAVVLPVLLAGATLGLFVAVAREPAGPREVTKAQRQPKLFLAFALLMLLISLTAAKVFSPQYLLWVIPLVAVAPLPQLARRWLMAAFLAVCALTTLIFPLLFWKHLLGMQPGDREPPIFNGPTLRGIVVLAVRNGLFVAVTAYVGVWIFRRWVRHAPPRVSERD